MKLTTNNLLLLLAELSYKRDNRVFEEAKKYNINIDIIHLLDLKMLLARHNNQIYISVRGSYNKLNWLRNFLLWKKKTTYGNIHFGFWSAANMLFKYLKNILTNDSKINISGHSFGAAVAHILAMRLENELKLNINTVNCYGEPAISDKIIYAPKFKYTKYLNNIDIVGMIPPSWLNYESSYANLTYITLDGNILHNPQKRDVLIDRLLTLKKHKELKELYKDHEVSSYKMYLIEA